MIFSEASAGCVCARGDQSFVEAAEDVCSAQSKLKLQAVHSSVRLQHCWTGQPWEDPPAPLHAGTKLPKADLRAVAT